MSIVVKTEINNFYSNRLEYKRQNLWILDYEDIPAYTLQSAQRPKLTLGSTMKVNFLTTHSKYSANTGEWQPITITINDSITKSAAKDMYNLALRQWNYKSGRVGTKAQYAKTLTLYLINPDGFDQLPSTPVSASASGTYDSGRWVGTEYKTSYSEKWTLYNVFIQDVDWNAAGLDYDATDRLKGSMTLVYDWAYLEDKP